MLPDQDQRQVADPDTDLGLYLDSDQDLDPDLDQDLDPDLDQDLDSDQYLDLDLFNLLLSIIFATPGDAPSTRP